MNTIGTRIEAKRQQLGMTMDELAKRLGYKDKSSICKIEIGGHDIPQAKVRLFAEALNTSVGYLMGTEDDTGVASFQTGLKVADALAEAAKSAPSEKELRTLIQTYIALTPAHRKKVCKFANQLLLDEQTKPNRKK